MVASDSVDKKNKVHIYHEENLIDDTMTQPTIEENSLASMTQGNLVLRLIKHRRFAPLFYILTGWLFVCFFIIIFNTYVLRLKIETAVVNAQIETMVAPVNGYIAEVLVAANDVVKKGMPMIKIENIDLERQLHLARIQAAESRLTIEYYQHLIKNEQQRLNIYRKIGRNRVISAHTTVEMSRQGVLLAQRNLNRFTALQHKNYVSKAILETKLAAYLSAKEKLKDAKAQQRLEKHSLNAVNKGMYFTGTKTEGIMRDLYAELEAAQKRTALNEDRVQIYENLISKLTLRAPFDGKVTQVLKSVGNTTDNIKPLLFIENVNSNKNIIAYLTQKEIIHIGASKKVAVYFPATGKTYPGKIIEINRTDGFIDEVKAQYRWRDFQVDRSALVTIAIQPNAQTEFSKYVFAGMPAVVYFSRKVMLF